MADDKALLWAAVTDIDLQIYKASIYKLRWDTPGAGLDLGLPALAQAQSTLHELVEWPEEISDAVEEVKERLDSYVRTLEARDHTTASGQQTHLFEAIARLRDQIRKI